MKESPSPSLPAPQPPQRRNGTGLILILLPIVLVTGLLAVLFQGFVIIVLAVLGVVGLHYFLWGWWLGEAIKREDEEEDRET